MKITKIAIAVATLMVSAGSWAHGFVMDPPSRAFLCKDITSKVPGYAGELNQSCGNIQYEPQSLEAPKGYPASGPKDGQIASANQTRGAEMDETGSGRWVKTEISAGQHQFKWYFTAPHPTSKYEYFITKNDWNPAQPLTRASFESTPFCTVPVANGERPGSGASVVHTCNVPEREGYQEILAVWTVHDTTNAFYNIIDVEFAGHNQTPDEDSGIVTPPPVEPDEPADDTPPNGNEEEHAAPVIHIALSHIIGNKTDVNTGYVMDASATKGAAMFKWELIEGDSAFQMQTHAGAPTYTTPLQGKDLNTMRAWVRGGATGVAKYRVTASNAHGSVSKIITLEVKNSDNGGINDPSVPEFAARVAYKTGDKVSYKGHIYLCLNAHTSFDHWNPAEAHSLWRKVK
ncbi:lytic polysaccharide monooxygenase [Pantoea sp. y20]